MTATQTYVAGRIFQDATTGRWVYEVFNHVISSERAADLGEVFADLYHRSESELVEQAERIKQARQVVITNEEERRAAAAANAAKKKGPQKGKVVEEPPKEEPKPTGPPPKKQLDLSKPEDFAQALREQIPRPFVFGPVEFTGLDTEPFPAEQWRATVESQLEKTI